jgi:hypothetical protein
MASNEALTFSGGGIARQSRVGSAGKPTSIEKGLLSGCGGPPQDRIPVRKTPEPADHVRMALSIS